MMKAESASTTLPRMREDVDARRPQRRASVEEEDRAAHQRSSADDQRVGRCCRWPIRARRCKAASTCTDVYPELDLACDRVWMSMEHVARARRAARVRRDRRSRPSAARHAVGFMARKRVALVARGVQAGWGRTCPTRSKLEVDRLADALRWSSTCLDEVRRCRVL